MVIVSNSMGTSREGMENADCVKDGGIAFNLRRALAERAQTARDGARILMELIDEWGYAPSGRAYTIADRDEAFVRDWCAAREIPFFAGRGDVRVFAEETGRTVEEAARQLRYEFLEETRRREGFGCILTAHHADDSAETMLLNLLRGTGLKGLTGIP